MLCVQVDQTGAVVLDQASTAPDCAYFALVSPVEIQSMTYWADLAMLLEPGGTEFNLLVTAMITTYASVAAIRLVVDQMVSMTKSVTER